MKRTRKSRAIINAAIIALIAIMGLSTTACPPEDNTIQETVNTAALVTKIAEAETARDDTNVRVSTDGTNVPSNLKWVTQSVKDTFENAINTAKGVKYTATSQSVVDNAVTTLDAAITAFNSAKKEGTELTTVPVELQGTWLLVSGKYANDPEYNIIFTSNTITWSGEGPFSVISITATHITIKFGEEEYSHEYELNGNIFRITDGTGAWQERQRV